MSDEIMKNEIPNKRKGKTVDELEAQIRLLQEKKRKVIEQERKIQNKERTKRLISKGAFMESILGDMPLDTMQKYILSMRKAAVESGKTHFQHDELSKKEKLIKSGSPDIKGRQLQELEEIIRIKNEEV